MVYVLVKHFFSFVNYFDLVGTLSFLYRKEGGGIETPRDDMFVCNKKGMGSESFNFRYKFLIQF